MLHRRIVDRFFLGIEKEHFNNLILPKLLIEPMKAEILGGKSKKKKIKKIYVTAIIILYIIIYNSFETKLYCPFVYARIILGFQTSTVPRTDYYLSTGGLIRLS